MGAENTYTLNNLTERDYAKIIFALTYTYNWPEDMALFTDPKTEFLDAIENGEDGYDIRAAAEDRNMDKNFNLLRRRWLNNREFFDYTQTSDAPLKNNQQITELLSSIEFISRRAYTIVRFNKGFSCDMYIKTSRGSRHCFDGITINEGSEFTLQSIFELGGSETFTLRLRLTDFSIALSPRVSTSGVKGAGELILGVEDSKGVYIDYADKYLDSTAIMRKFSG